MSTVRNGLLIAVVLAIAAAPALAIELGDPAPALKVKEWVKGKPVDLAQGKDKNTYVIEFWTLTAEKEKTFPHLADLMKKYKDKGLVVAAINSADGLDAVKTFVKDKGDKVDFAVGYEEKGKGETYKAYMDAFHKTGMPEAFVIDKKGAIVWEGHPLFGMDEVVEAVLTGNSDVKKLQEVAEKAAKETLQRIRLTQDMMTKYFELVTGSKEAEGAKELGERVLKGFGDDPMVLNEFAWKILTDEGVMTRDLDLALRAAKLANDLSDGKDAAIMDTYARALWDSGKKKEALDLQKKAVDLCKEPEMKAELEKTLKKYQEKP